MPYKFVLYKEIPYNIVSTIHKIGLVSRLKASISFIPACGFLASQ